MLNRHRDLLMSKYVSLAKFPASVCVSKLAVDRPRNPLAGLRRPVWPGQDLDSGLDLPIHLESAAFVFHMSAMTRVNRRVFASRVF